MSRSWCLLVGWATAMAVALCVLASRSGRADQAAQVRHVRGASYRLAGDLARRTQGAQRQLGARARIAVVEQVFLVVGAPPMSKRLFERSLDLIRRSTAAYFNNRFRKRPARAVEVFLFANERTYRRYCKRVYGGCGTPFGVYYRRDRRIVMNVAPGLGTLTHELIHPIMATDFPGAPDWIDEGIASLFEYPWIPTRGEIHGKTNWRLPRLRRALRSSRERDKVSLARLFGMADATFRGRDEGLNYAMARYFAQWMDARGLLWTFYQRWRDNAKSDPTGAKAFHAVTKKTPAEATPAWRAWIREL